MVDQKVVAVSVVSGLAVISLGFLFWRQKRQKVRAAIDASSRPVADEQLDGKPQRRFRCVLADNSLSPFVHLRTEESGEESLHPYGQRIRALLEQPPPAFLLQESPEVPAGTDGPFEWVETTEQLEALAHILSNETEFAVDTEQHSFHSFHGFTALVQVFHGADSDILWLQRDFHMYVVNMFDTAKACIVLDKPQRSLAYLLKTYCGVITNKAYQRADWRIRPLTEDMVEYARTDAHYLLYIAQQLSLELSQQSSGAMKDFSTELGIPLQGDLLELTWCRSNLNCLQLFEKEIVCDPATTASTMISRFRFLHEYPLPSQVNPDLVEKVIRLCEWRKNVARAEDESLRSVLSDTALIALACSCPQTPELIFTTVAAADASPPPSDALISPIIPTIDSPSPVLEQYIDELCDVIQDLNSSCSELSPSQAPGRLSPKSYLSVLYDKLCSPLNFFSASVSGNDSKDMNGLWKLKTPRQSKGRNTERSRMQFVKKFSCKAPVYHNCRIYADDGRLLCFCDRRKLDWYVRRGLAEFIQEDPPAVKLLFEPKGRPDDEGNDFYVQSKSNRCVGCGESSHYLRYRIIPSCYRQYFPEHLKSHRSHDIVLLCVDCHEAAHKAAENHKRRIAEQFGVPLFAKVMDGDGGENEAVVPEPESGKGVSPLRLKNASMALLLHGSKIPTQRREELEEVVKAFYGRKNISQQDLRAALLVSMGPHERHRLSKKRLCRESPANKATDEEATHLSDAETLSGNQREHSSALTVKDENVQSEAETCRSLIVDTQDDAASEHPESRQTASTSNYLETDNDNERIFIESLPSRRQSHRHRSRKNGSLLGHGAHGRRVVEALMAQDGDEGIRVFCQQWRAVFVEALKPAFLPPGWDIAHSGRREFGDYSVYKPSDDTTQQTS
ncbi:hypothetical protein AXG93_1988s1090 [Marchantia polymorpha subsp. ruderalis]|uniref:HRDC domain-containing protein n=1 Tax=Marchantia polymorpha subsp. ruderalis TaxID=1480154 RepID=A0A176VXC2_MARPO|nr:hypothetical protein AXG93_1988s1090 [Marchantia polymorpha subsp. ruderalis]